MKLNKARPWTVCFTLFLLFAIFLTNPLHVSAAELPTDFTAEPYSTSKPNKAWDFSKGRYEFSGSANQSELFSNYYFTGVSKVEIHVYNYHDEELTVKLLKQQTGVDFSVDDEHIPSGQYKTWSVSLDSSRVYMLKFYAPCDFTGYIADIS